MVQKRTPVTTNTVKAVMPVVKATIYRFGDKNTTKPELLVSLLPPDIFQAIAIMAARIPSTPTKTAQKDTERRWLGLG